MIKILAVGMIAALLKSCYVPPSNDCEAIRQILYHDGNFSFKKSEIDALEERNQIKIVGFKNWYKKNCSGVK